MRKPFISNKEKLKEHGIRNPRNYLWCSYCKTFHKKEAFYNNSYTSTGFQLECKVVSRLRVYKLNYEEALQTFPKREQRLFKCCR